MYTCNHIPNIHVYIHVVVKSKPQQQLSPAQMRKTNVLGPPSTLSPSLPSKLNTGSCVRVCVCVFTVLVL